MSQQSIFEIKKGQNHSREAVANLLPCRVHHTGPVDPASAYWNPSVSEDGTALAYFRGRKLQGKTITLPEQCRGVVLERKDERESARDQPAVEEQEEEGDDGAPLKIGTMQVTAEFGKMVVWSHEAIANATSDPYMRSVEEWLQVAGQIHSYEEDQDDQDKK